MSVMLFNLNTFLVQKNLPGADYMLGVLIPAVESSSKAKKGDLQSLRITVEALLFNGITGMLCIIV